MCASCRCCGLDSNMVSWSVTLTESDALTLTRHLLQEDGEEHGAFLYSGLSSTSSGERLLVRRIEPVPDEQFKPDPVSGQLQISARAVAHAAIGAEAEGCCLLWAHSHPGSGNRVGFSPQDHRTIERAHPTLLDLTRGKPVGALVVSENAIAGEIWTRDAPPEPLEFTRIVGNAVTDVRAIPGSVSDALALSARFDRQLLLFGAEGQHRLRGLRVGVVGTGGGGSILVEQLAHLGVGEIVLMDFDTVTWSNLSRIVGSRPIDAVRRRHKVQVLARLARQIDPKIRVRSHSRGRSISR